MCGGQRTKDSTRGAISIGCRHAAGVRTVKTMEEAQEKKERLRARREDTPGTQIRAVCQDLHGLVESPNTQSCGEGFHNLLRQKALQS